MGEGNQFGAEIAQLDGFASPRPPRLAHRRRGRFCPVAVVRAARYGAGRCVASRVGDRRRRAGGAAGVPFRTHVAGAAWRPVAWRLRVAGARNRPQDSRQRHDRGRRHGLRLPAGTRLRHRPRWLELRFPDACVRSAGRQAVRPGHGRMPSGQCVRADRIARIGQPRVFQGRRIRRWHGRDHRRTGRSLHVLSCTHDPDPGRAEQRGRRLAGGVSRSPVHREDLGVVVHCRFHTLRRRLEYAAPCDRVRSRLHRARPCLCVGRDAHEIPVQEVPARAVGAADHHATLRCRAGPDPAFRPLRPHQPVSGMGVRRHAHALALRHARRARRADLRVHADRLPCVDRRRRRRLARARGSSANASRRQVAHVRRRFIAADAPRPRQRLSHHLHRIHCRFRQSDPARRKFRRAVHRDLLFGRRRATRPGPRCNTRHRAAGVRARRLLPATSGSRPEGLHVDVG